MALDKPLIAAVDGVAFGAGLSMALFADIVLVSTRARLAMVFHRMGLVPDVGAFFNLPRIVGLQRAKELIYSAREFGADEAVRMDLALEALPPEALLPRAMELAGSFEGTSPIAFSLSKRALQASLQGDFGHHARDGGVVAGHRRLKRLRPRIHSAVLGRKSRRNFAGQGEVERLGTRRGALGCVLPESSRRPRR
jgi:enoyl-CoA hydratase/carnithine racemase